MEETMLNVIKGRLNYYGYETVSAADETALTFLIEGTEDYIKMNATSAMFQKSLKRPRQIS